MLTWAFDKAALCGKSFPISLVGYCAKKHSRMCARLPVHVLLDWENAEVQVIRQTVCHPFYVRTMRVHQHIPYCGVKAVSQGTFLLRGPSPEWSSCRRLLLDQVGIQWVEVDKVVIRLLEWGEGSHSVCIPYINIQQINCPVVSSWTVYNFIKNSQSRVQN